MTYFFLKENGPDRRKQKELEFATLCLPFLRIGARQRKGALT